MAESESTNKNVLIVSFLFPPINTPGALRVGKMAKYLPEFGWRPILLTSEVTKDTKQALPIEMNKGDIIRTPSLSLSDLFIEKKESEGFNSSDLKYKKVDGYKTKIIHINIMRFFKPIYTLPVIKRLISEPIGWRRNAIRAGLEIIKNHKIDVIYSSFGPSVSHLVASKLQKKTGIPWIAEFRDPWSFNMLTRKAEPFNLLERKWEKRVMRNCDLIITVSKTWADKLESFHSKRVIVIPNGFDEDNYLNNIQLTRKFTITYTGYIYPDQGNPAPFFQAIAELLHEGIISADNFEVRFLGSNIEQTICSLIEIYNLEEIVYYLGFVALKESIKTQKESTALLLISWNDPSGAGILPAKLFEYMGARRPILALAYKNGETDKLLQQSGCGLVANKSAEIKDIVKRWVAEFRQKGKIVSYYNPQEKTIMNYTRKEQAKKLAEVLRGNL